MDSSPFIEKPMDASVELNKLKFQLKDLQTELSLKKIEHEEEVHGLKKELEQCQLKSHQFESDSIYYYTQNKQNCEKLESMEKECCGRTTRLETTIDALKKELKSLKSVEEANEQLTSELKLLQQQHSMCKEQLKDSESVRDGLQKEVDSLHSDVTHWKLQNELKQDEVLKLQRQIQTVDNSEELKSISKQLSNQVSYIKELELKNLNQAESLKQLQLQKLNNEVLQNENRSFQVKLQSMDKLKDELDSTTLELLQLKQESSKWNLYLDKFPNIEELLPKFKSLQDENLLLKDQLNKQTLEQSQLQFQLNNIKVKLENQEDEMTRVKANWENVLKINHELEQQRDLSLEESKYLRQQLGLDDGDDMTEYVKNLETLVDNYKEKVDDLTKSLSKGNVEVQQKKRKLSTSADFEDFQSLKQMNGQLQLEMSQLMNENALLIKQLESIQDIKEQKLRILQLRDNPFTKDQFVKRKQLELLQKSNESLLNQSHLKEDEKIPKAVYEEQNFTIVQLQDQLANLQKKNQRLLTTFKAKSSELLALIKLLFGYQVTLQSDDKVKLTSNYSKLGNSNILIDHKQMTLKRTGDDVDFNTKFDDLIGYWINEKGEIPMLLSALNIELYSNLD